MTDTAVAQRRGPKRDIPMLDSQRKNLPYPKMELEVQDFGPIAKGKIDLRPLTLFVGPSNTGKSWMAMLVYSMASVLSARPGAEVLTNASLLLRKDRLQDILANSQANSFPEDPDTWRSALMGEGMVTLTDVETKLVCRAAELSKFDFLDEMTRCIGVATPRQMIRWGIDKNAKVSVSLDEICYGMEIGETMDSTSMKVRIEKNSTLNFSRDTAAMNPGERGGYLNQMLYSMQDWLSGDEDKSLTDPINRMSATLGLLHANRNLKDTFFIPAARGGITQTYDAIVEGLLYGASRARPEERDSEPMITGAVGDFQRGIIRAWRESRKKIDRPPELESSLEANVLCGTVDFEQVLVGHPRVYYQPSDSDVRLPIINTSAMISDMAPIALYLKYLVRAGDLLVLEEPEMNMHPDLQRLFVKEVVRWVNSGVRVVITTHSDFVLDELSNTVARSKLEEKSPGKRVGTRLDERNIGVWYFDYIEMKQRDSGTTIKHIEWNPDLGGYDAGFIEVVETINNDWARAMNAIGWTED